MTRNVYVLKVRFCPEISEKSKFIPTKFFICERVKLKMIFMSFQNYVDWKSRNGQIVESQVNGPLEESHENCIKFAFLSFWNVEFFVVYQRLYRLIGHLKLILNLVLNSFFVKNDKFSKQKKWVTTWRFVTLTTLDRKIRFLIKNFLLQKVIQTCLILSRTFLYYNGRNT